MFYGLSGEEGGRLMRHPMAKTHLASCRHEAAHAILMEYFGGRIIWAHAPVLTDRVKRGVGAVQYGDTRKLGPVQMWCVMMAGSVAEHLWHGTPKGLASEHDFDDMRRSGMKGEDFRIIWEETSRLVRRLKKPIWQLARRLKSGKRIRRFKL